MTEPRGRLEQWLYRFERGSGGLEAVGARAARERSTAWSTCRWTRSPTARRADVLRLEDFELEMREGRAVHRAREPRARPCSCSWAKASRTCARGRRPSGSSCGSSRAARSWRADVERRLRAHPSRRPAPRAGAGRASSRTPRARVTCRTRGGSTTSRWTASFVLDAALPGSPWWLLPGPGRRLGDVPDAPARDAHLRAQHRRARGHQPVRPGAAAPDPALPAGGRDHRLRRGRAARSSTCCTTTCSVRFEPDAPVHRRRGHAPPAPARPPAPRSGCASTATCASSPSGRRRWATCSSSACAHQDTVMVSLGAAGRVHRRRSRSRSATRARTRRPRWRTRWCRSGRTIAGAKR